MRAPVREFASVPEGRAVGFLLQGRDRRPLQRELARGYAGRQCRVCALPAVASGALQGRLAPGLPSAAIDQLDPVAVRVADEADARAALAHAVRLAFGLDALLLQPRQRLVDVVDAHCDVPVARSELVR